METLVTSIRGEVSAAFEGDNTGHDLAHLDRVHGLAEQLRATEGGDAIILAGASYVHDFHRVLERESGSYGALDTRDDATRLIEQTLAAVGYPADRVAPVCECVAFTERYSFSGHSLAAPSLEARILRDADNLDALGAVGIARAFMFGGALGEPIWVDDTRPAEIYEAGATSSIVHHFHEKLLRLKEDMLTDTGRALAEDRHDFMVAFLNRLRSEWEGAGLSQNTAPSLPRR